MTKEINPFVLFLVDLNLYKIAVNVVILSLIQIKAILRVRKVIRREGGIVPKRRGIKS